MSRKGAGPARVPDPSSRELFDSERRFRLLVEGVIDYAIYVLDPNGIITNWNAGAARIKGYAAHEVIGRHFGMFYTPEDRAGGFPRGRSKPRGGRAASRPKVGGCVRTAHASSPRS